VDTKDADNKKTLLHFLIGELRGADPTLARFVHERWDVVANAARVDADALAKGLAQLRSNVSKVGTSRERLVIF